MCCIVLDFWNCVFSIVGAVATQRVSGGYHVAFNSFAGGDSVVCFLRHFFFSPKSLYLVLQGSDCNVNVRSIVLQTILVMHLCSSNPSRPMHSRDDARMHATNVLDETTARPSGSLPICVFPRVAHQCPVLASHRVVCGDAKLHLDRGHTVCQLVGWYRGDCGCVGVGQRFSFESVYIS